MTNPCTYHTLPTGKPKPWQTSHQMGAAQSAATVTRSDADGARVHLDCIRRLVYDSFPGEFAVAGIEDDGEDLLDILCGVHDLEQSLFLFARLPARSNPVGFALFFRYNDALYASTLCVTPACRRQGIGSLLMRSGSALAFSMGVPTLTGSVDAAAAHLLTMYTRLGAAARPLPPSGPGAVVFTRRFDAPSGPVTARDAPVPGIDPGKSAVAAMAPTRTRSRPIPRLAAGAGLLACGLCAAARGSFILSSSIKGAISRWVRAQLGGPCWWRRIGERGP